MSVIDLIGQTFGRLTVLSRGPNGNRGQARWLCKCVCGKEKVILGESLNKSRTPTRSCGCLHKEVASSFRGKPRTHGHSIKGRQSPTYNSWRNAKSRCNNKKDPSYDRYGGAVIGWPTEWDSFENFLNDMGERTEGRTLDRIDGSKGYSKENCKWSTYCEQGRNEKSNRLSMEKAVEIRKDYYLNGKTQTDIARDLGIDPSTVSVAVRFLTWWKD